jgi:hypothetical protein
MDRGKVEKQARLVQYEIWHKRHALFPLGVPSPLAMFQPDIAARALGVEYEHREQLGRFGQGNDRFETAGMIDRRRGIIAVSTRFPYPARRFTGAHEIGHYVMHPHEVMHRDRPVFDAYGRARPPQEQEADYFAACFLAPRRLVEEEFAARFIKNPPLPLTDAVAWNLLGESAHELRGPSAGSLDFAAAVAGAQSFNGRRFKSLAELFGISVSAMAIRLQELGLVTE